MVRFFLYLLSGSFLFAAQGSTLSFQLINKITWETVIPDSIYIENLTQQQDTVLTGIATFDLTGPTGLPNVFSSAPDQFKLAANYPNPFIGQTKAVVSLPKKDDIALRVFNILGQEVARMSSHLPAGSHSFRLKGSGLPNGLYFIQVSNSLETRTLKMIKSGNSAIHDVFIEYAGPVAAPLEQGLFKFDHRPGDHYRFTVYADGFYPETLDDQVPEGNETYSFELNPVPPPDDFTSHWFGFNLLGKFTVEWSNEGYIENDFAMISEFGFNFVRLPIDYRTFTRPGDWTVYDAAGLEDIDNAVAWGQDYGIHVSINLHRAPGYCVNPPSTPLPANQDVSLWNNKDAQAAFAAQWRMFAERYQDVPGSALSFNLVNEPSSIDGATYVDAVLPAIEAILEVSPDRIIISDGVDYGNARVDEILAFGVIMSPHFYNPFQLTHYKAEWADGSDTWPEPVWPPQMISNYFYGSFKSPLDTPLEIEGEFPAGTRITLHAQQVSTSADFRVMADGEVMYTHQFSPGPGEGEWEQVIFASEWNIYQNIYNRDYTFTLESDASKLSMRVYTGDWMTFSELSITPPASSALPAIIIQPGISDWGVPQARYRANDDGTLIVIQAPAGYEDYFVMNGFLDQWITLKKSGTPVHVGEWGVYNKTPHGVTLRFMENRLQALQSAGFGWALWNFRGSFGVLDSGRSDVHYENYMGHQLDREMLELLLNYTE